LAAFKFRVKELTGRSWGVSMAVRLRKLGQYVCNTPVKKVRDHRFIAQPRMITMTDTIYCYHCRRHHPADEVRLVQTKGGKRWRCMQSLRSCRGSRVRRDAFGKSVSEFNQAINEWKAVQPLPHCVRELFSGKPA
jgi:hypothetical protein